MKLEPHPIRSRDARRRLHDATREGTAPFSLAEPYRVIPELPVERQQVFWAMVAAEWQVELFRFHEWVGEGMLALRRSEEDRPTLVYFVTMGTDRPERGVVFRATKGVPAADDEPLQ